MKNELKENENPVNTDTPVTAKKNDYLVYNIEPYSSNNYKKVIDESINMGGNKYNNGFKLGGSYSNGYATYNLDGKYTELSGLIGYEDPGDEDDIEVEFWGDDSLFHSHIVKGRDLPREFAVDLTGIKKLEIRIKNGIKYSVDFAQIKIK